MKNKFSEYTAMQPTDLFNSFNNSPEQMSNPLKVIDISKPEDTVIEDLLDAAVNQGFLFVDGHDFQQAEVDTLFDLSSDFFTKTPGEEKQKYEINKNNIGYTGFTTEQLDPRKTRDFKEGYNFGFVNFKTGEFNQSEDRYYGRTDIDNANENPVPPLFEKNSGIISETTRKLHRIALKILELITVALQVEDRRFFVDRHRPEEPSGCVFRMLRYPLIREDDLEEAKQANPDVDPTIRAGAHTDYGSLTLLFQRQGQQGLQLQMGDKDWVEVPFVKSQHEGSAPPLVVNFGDLLSYWTNGLLKSTIHRVKFSPGETRTSDRYSIVFFVHPENATQLTPVPSKLVRDAGGGIEPTAITALEHLNQRLADTYASINY